MASGRKPWRIWRPRRHGHASALLLILRVALPDAYALWIVVGLVVWCVLCWFVLPAWARRNGPGNGSRGGSGHGSGGSPRRVTGN